MNTNKSEQKNESKNGILRMAIVCLSVILQALFIISLFTWLSGIARWIEAGTSIIALFFVLMIYSKDSISAIKTPWILLIMVFPVVGMVLYLLVIFNPSVKKMKRKYERIDGEIMPYMTENPSDAAALAEACPEAAAISRYLTGCSGYPVRRGTDAVYFSDAKEAFDAQIEAMAKAESFIFLEYHAIENKESWSRVRDVLTDRCAAGVDVRVIYDDMGSIGFVNTDFAEEMELLGIKCRIFNPFHLGRSLFLNNRDHRKITVIDGVIGFTGGYNIANEYFNIDSPYGRWKDTGICLFGDAVNSLTVTFFEMWKAIDGVEEDIGRFLPPPARTSVAGGFFQPYADSPLDSEHVGEEVYINLVNSAREYCWFMTPYLIITDEMEHALRLAAKRGVDVRIITPGIPDKKLIFKVTCSFYTHLVKDGVRIFQWTPGFCHAKMCIVDGCMATCGTINLDYRSLYHHFENNVFMVCTPVIDDIKKDFLSTMEESDEVTGEYREGKNRFLSFGQMFLRLFAELL